MPPQAVFGPQVRILHSLNAQDVTQPAVDESGLAANHIIAESLLVS